MSGEEEEGCCSNPKHLETYGGNGISQQESHETQLEIQMSELSYQGSHEARDKLLQRGCGGIKRPGCHCQRKILSISLLSLTTPYHRQNFGSVHRKEKSMKAEQGVRQESQKHPHGLEEDGLARRAGADGGKRSNEYRFSFPEACWCCQGSQGGRLGKGND